MKQLQEGMNFESSRPLESRQTQSDDQVFVFSRSHRVVAAGLFLFSLIFNLLNYGLVDDHFDRISRGRQIAKYGELPFKDFFDPGYFLTLFSSAGVQTLFGDSLVGEALLNGVGFSVGFALTFLMLVRTTTSLPVAGVVTVLVMLAGPRFYDYDKVLFYPLGVFLCWRYFDRTSVWNLVTLALATTCAFWFRYDNGIFIACGTAVGLFVVHWRSRVTFACRLALYAVVIVVMSLPCLVFLQVNGGVLDYIYQITSYANREGNRTRVFELPQLQVDDNVPLFIIEPPAGYPITVRWVEGLSNSARSALERQFLLSDPEFDGERTWSYVLHDNSSAHVGALVRNSSVEDTGSIDRGAMRVLSAGSLKERVRRVVPFLRMQVLPGVLSLSNIFVFVYYLFVAIPVLAVAFVWRKCLEGRRSYRWEPEAARVLCLTTICILIESFILRDPLTARIGAVAAPVGILGVWILASVELPRRCGDWVIGVTVRLDRCGVSVKHFWQQVNAMVYLRRIVWTVLGIGGLFLGQSGFFTAQSIVATLDQKLTALAVSPPSMALLPNGRDSGMVRYIQECTGPDDRILATWFVPQLYAYAGRGFAGGMVVFFGGHWSDRAWQEKTLSRLREQSVPIVLVETDSYASFERDYDLIDSFIKANYRLAGMSSLGNPDVDETAYRILVRDGLTPVRFDDSWQLPCFS